MNGQRNRGGLPRFLIFINKKQFRESWFDAAVFERVCVRSDVAVSP